MGDIAPPAVPLSQVHQLVDAYDKMRRVRASDATVTMVKLPELEQFRDRLAAAYNAAKTMTDSLRQVATRLRLPIADAFIAANDDPPAAVAELVVTGRQARDELVAAQQSESEIRCRPHHGVSGLVHRIADHHDLDQAEARLKLAEAEFSNAREALAAGLPPALEGGAEPGARDQLTSLEAALAENDATLKPAGELIDTLDAEIADRHREADVLHFDRLLVMASIYADGPQVVDAPVVVKAGERAHVSVAARLARHKTRRRYVGATQGVSIPVYKGIRYRVGAFSGHPISEDYVAVVDTGTFVLTNQRIVFVGAAKLLQMPLAKVIHVGTYSDALEIGHEGKESMDIFLLDSPQYVLCFLNYLLTKAGNPTKS